MLLCDAFGIEPTEPRNRWSPPVTHRLTLCDASGVALRYLRHRTDRTTEPVVAFGDAPATLCDASGVGVVVTNAGTR